LPGDFFYRNCPIKKSPVSFDPRAIKKHIRTMSSTAAQAHHTLSVISDAEREKFYKARHWYAEGEYLQEEMEVHYSKKGIQDMDRKLYEIGKPPAFSNIKDPHPKELLSFPEVAEYMHKLVSVDGDASGKKYRVFWSAFQLEVSDYMASKMRSEITFVHVHILVPEELFVPPPVGNIGSYKRDAESRRLDNYCVRLPNKKFFKVDQNLVKKLYNHVKATEINKDNVLIVGEHVLTYMPQDLYESKIALEEGNLSNANNRSSEIKES
jgi:hypothetical protein